MIKKHIFLRLLLWLVIGHPLAFPVFLAAQEPIEIFTLQQTVENAIAANIALKSSKEEIKAASAAKKGQQTNFLPVFSTSYQHKRNKIFSDPLLGDLVPKHEYRFTAEITQPIFAGFSLLNKYKIAKLGLDVAEINEKLVRQDIIFNAKKSYFSLLEAQKLFDIAQKTVTQLEAHREVANNYYQVGMTPLNDFLQAQVELANAEQDLIVAKNDMENAESDFNLLLRRPLDTPVNVKDILDYSSFEQNLDYCLSEAEKNRLEIKISDLDVEIAEKELKLAKKDFYPSINLKGSYYQFGTDWKAKGGFGIISNPSSWEITTVASWDFWEWGRTSYGTKEKKSRLSQAQLRKKEMLDNIHLEVKKAYLRTQEAEKAIVMVEKAIEQAKENFRINKERYKAQVAASTDVLDAQTLLAKTITNYYKALYAFKISKAALYRAIGQELIE